MPSLKNLKKLSSDNDKKSALSALDANSSLPNFSNLWQEIVDDSRDGWIWHTWLFHEFNHSAGEKNELYDLSFFVMDEKRAVGVVPLIVQKKPIGNYQGLEASYYGGFLPWPCFRRDLAPARMLELEDFAFTELEKRARKAGAGHIKIMLIPPQDLGNEVERVRSIANKHRYVATTFDFHRFHIRENTLSEVRVCSRQYHRKFSPLFEFSIAEGRNVTEQVEKEYLHLHVKNAGGQFRSDDSYTKQADFARFGEAFYVIAREKKSGKVAGMLLVNLYKNAAYYGSVAIDPAFKNKQVGHLLTWRVIEELLKRGIKTYELGPRYINPSTLTTISTSKERGINLFKEAWARGETRKIYEIEKFLSKDFLNSYINTLDESLVKYFGLE
ncbi:MAG: GNAT family N-acetyltransferase [Patescibacteria group bacterium]